MVLFFSEVWLPAQRSSVSGPSVSKRPCDPLEDGHHLGGCQPPDHVPAQHGGPAVHDRLVLGLLYQSQRCWLSHQVRAAKVIIVTLGCAFCKRSPWQPGAAVAVQAWLHREDELSNGWVQDPDLLMVHSEPLEFPQTFAVVVLTLIWLVIIEKRCEFQDVMNSVSDTDLLCSRK